MHKAGLSHRFIGGESGADVGRKADGLFAVIAGVPAGTIAPRKKGFDLLTRPGSFAQELKAGFDAGVDVKTADRDLFAKTFPPVNFDQFRDHHLKRDALGGVFVGAGFFRRGRIRSLVSGHAPGCSQKFAHGVRFFRFT